MKRGSLPSPNPQQPRVQPLLLNNQLPRLSFTPENPTGNYFLDLANPADFAVAEQVLVLNQWEILQLVKGKTEKQQQTKRKNRKKGSKDVVFKGLFVVCFEVFYFFDSWMCFE